MISELDAKLSKQIDLIVHHPDFQKLESPWRGLKFVVDRTDFRENIKLEVLNVSKEDLITDFEDAPESQERSLQDPYTRNTGSSVVSPTAGHLLELQLQPAPQDVALSRRSRRWRHAHAPFFGAAGSRLLRRRITSTCRT